jgi:GTP cyclohydrolase II
MSQLYSELKMGVNPEIRTRVSIPMQGVKGSAEFFSFRNISDNLEHIAICFGAWEKTRTPLVRIHSECLTGDVFRSSKCDCGQQLNESIEMAAEQSGIILYLRQEGRGIGLYNKLDAYKLQAQGHDTYDANAILNFPRDPRSYQCASEMLGALGIFKVRLLTNNPEKSRQLEIHGIEVVEQKSTGVFVTPQNLAYLKSKILKTNHKIKIERSKEMTSK